MNKKEIVSYLKALLYIATIDENFDDNEKKYISNMANLYELTNEQVKELEMTVINREESLEDILSEIKSRQVKLSLIYELMYLCYIDGNYCEREHAGMENIREILDIESEKLDEIEKLVIEVLKLQERIDKTLEK